MNIKLTQCDIILRALLLNKNKKEWTAKEFQYGEHFVGYETTARMSDLLRLYPNLLIAGKNGRYRTLSVDWENTKQVEEEKKRLNIK